MKALPFVTVALAVMLGQCSRSESDKQVDDLVASTKTCGDYAALAAWSNCIRFVDEKRNPASAKNFGQLVNALEKRWNKKCADRLQDIETLQLKTTIALTANGLISDQTNSLAICKAQVDKSLAAYPALANDRSKFTR